MRIGAVTLVKKVPAEMSRFWRGYGGHSDSTLTRSTGNNSQT